MLVALVLCLSMVWRVAGHLEQSRAGSHSASPAAEASEPPDDGTALDTDLGTAHAGLANLAGAPGAAPLVAVRVGTVELESRQLDAALERLTESARQRGERVDFAWRERHRTRLLDERIEALVLEQSLATQAAVIAPERVAAALEAHIAERFAGRRENLERYLAVSGRTFAALEHDLRLELAVLDAIGGDRALAADDAELEAIWREHRALFRAPARARVEILALATRDGDDGEQAWHALRQQAATVAEALAQPRGDAHALARRHRLDLTHDASTWVMQGTLPAPLDEALFGSLPADSGQVLGPLLHDERLWLVRVREWRPAGERALDEVRAVVAARARERKLATARRELAARFAQAEEAGVTVERLDDRWYRKLQRRLRAR